MPDHPSLILGPKSGDKKIKGEKKKKDNREHQGGKKGAVEKRDGISGVNVY